MMRDRFVKVMLVLIAVLLFANLVQDLVSIKPAFAAISDFSSEKNGQISGTGSAAWVLFGSQIFYVKFNTKYKEIDITGPEILNF